MQHEEPRALRTKQLWQRKLGIKEDSESAMLVIHGLFPSASGSISKAVRHAMHSIMIGVPSFCGSLGSGL